MSTGHKLVGRVCEQRKEERREEIVWKLWGNSPAESPILLWGKMLGLLVIVYPSQGFPVPEADSKISCTVHKDGIHMFILT